MFHLFAADESLHIHQLNAPAMTNATMLAHMGSSCVPTSTLL